MSLGLGLGVDKSHVVAPTRGPELSPTAGSGAWAITTNGGAAGTVTQDANGIHFSGAQNVAAVFKNGVATEDNTTYEIIFTVANFVGGKAKVIVYGATTLHSGGTLDRTANGTYTEQVVTSSGGTNALQIRIQCTGTNGTNTFDVTSISVKKVM